MEAVVTELQQSYNTATELQQQHSEVVVTELQQSYNTATELQQS